MGSYSWLWWTNGEDWEGRRHWSNAPVDRYGCFGHGGKRAMAVLPGLDLIVSWNDTRVDGREMENEAFRLLVDAASGGQKRTRGDLPQRAPSIFVCGPEDFLYRGTLNPDGTRSGDQAQRIDRLKGTGANCLYVRAIRSHGGHGDRTHNPFLGHDPAQGRNPAVVDPWEQWFTVLDHNGIVTYLILYDDSARVRDTGDEVGEPERGLVETLVSRFEHHVHLVWCIAEEYAEKLSAEQVRRLAALIQAEDDYDHPIAVHKNHGLRFAEFADDPSIDQFAIPHNVKTADELHAGVVQTSNEARGRYSLNLAEAADWGTDVESRRKCWACAMAGASIMVLGMDIASTAVTDLVDCGNVVRFFEMVDRQGMEPHDELGHTGTQYMLAKPGERHVAYASNTCRRLGLRERTAGRYALLWFDCVNGATVFRESVDVAEGSQT